MTLSWYLIYTKLRQEKVAKQNLEQQGYECYLPMLRVEMVRRCNILVTEEPLFPRYMFIRLDNEGTSKSWAPIRSTVGVHRLVSFGVEPAKVDDRLIELLRNVQQKLLSSASRPLFNAGERLMLTDSPFTNIEAIYQATNGEGRVVVLLEMLGKSVSMLVLPTSVRKLG